MHVTEAHLDFYKDQGYVIIEDGLSIDLITFHAA